MKLNIKHNGLVGLVGVALVAVGVGAYSWPLGLVVLGAYCIVSAYLGR